MANYTRLLVYTSESNVNGVAVGNTLLTRTRVSEGGQQFNLFLAFCKIINAANISVGATFSVGTNSPNFNNIIPAQTMVGPIRTFQIATIANPQLAVAEDTDINIRVSVAATGGGAVLTFRIALVGIEV